MSTPIPDTITPTQNNRKSTTDTPLPDENSIDSTITKQAVELEKHIEDALDDLSQEDNIHEEPSPQLLSTLQQLVADEVRKTLSSFHEKAKELDNDRTKVESIHTQCISLHKDLKDTNDRIISNLHDLSQKSNKWEHEFKNMTEVYNEHLNEFNTVRNEIHTKSQRFHNIQSEINDTQTGMQKRLTKIKSTTKHLYQQHEEESEILNDCVHRLEENLAQLKRYIYTPTRKALKNDTTSESDSSTTDNQNSLSEPSPIFTPSNVTQSNTYTLIYNTQCSCTTGRQ